jgi:acetylornithine deacetylase
MKKEHLELLREFVSFRPVSADPAAVDRVQERMKKYLEEHGIFCILEQVEDRHLLFASTTGNKTPDILFNPHVDVVPATNPDEQYVLELREDERLYGRGVADDLGNAICVAQTLIELKGKADAGAIFTGNEEVGGSTTDGMIKLGYGAKKMVVVADGNGGLGRVTYAHKGVVILKLIARGKTGHSSRPWAFDNAIEKLMTGYMKLAAAWDNPKSVEDWRNTMAPCIISGGQAVNQIPGEASLIVNFRITGAEDLETIPKMVAETTGLEVEFMRGCLPFNGDPQAPQLRLLAEILLAKSGKVPEFVKMTGATDARHLQKLGVPVAILGCQGVGGHSACEYLESNAIDRMVPVFVELATRL